MTTDQSPRAQLRAVVDAFRKAKREAQTADLYTPRIVEDQVNTLRLKHLDQARRLADDARRAKLKELEQVKAKYTALAQERERRKAADAPRLERLSAEIDRTLARAARKGEHLPETIDAIREHYTRAGDPLALVALRDVGWARLAGMPDDPRARALLGDFEAEYQQDEQPFEQLKATERAIAFEAEDVARTLADVEWSLKTS